jgi:hypothetical protein
MPEDDHIVDYRNTAYSPHLRERMEASMQRASGSEHAYSHSSKDVRAKDVGANDNRWPALDAWRRLRVSQWVALVGLATLLATSTVHALTPPPKFVPTPEFHEQMEKLALAIMLMPCDHREPGYPDMRVADLRGVSASPAD